MFNNAHLDRLRQSFADQFSDGEHGVIYRKYQKGVPFRVSKAERDGFVAVFNKRIRYATWSIFPVTVGLILLLVWLTPGSDSPVAQIAMWGGIAAILLPFMVIFYWAWGAPSRELECQTPEGPALTKEEARALAFSKITYGQLALAALMGVGLIWKMSIKIDVFHGWGVIWLAFGAAVVVLAGVQAIRKWRSNQQQASQ
ncbi:MAG: hypothetical protein EOO77_10890 [Oxalobacteraceae bacterium]|nr:MAG: hypothetical protein EOO77_10890 [Oxalobacteraceae bacterium]